MSNIKAARQAIEDELKHVEKGIEFYQSRAAALRQALKQLESVEETGAGKSRQSARVTGRAASTKRGRKAKGNSFVHKLPRTSTDYWLQFITHEPKSAVEIANAAIASLGFKASAEHVKKMKQRVAPALQSLLTSKQIKDVGTGRQRRFFLPLAKTAGPGKQNAKSRSTPVNTNGTVLH